MTTRQKIISGILLTPLICGVGGYASIVLMLRATGSTIEADLARAKRAGIKTELSDLKRVVPASENAAPIYQEITKRIMTDKALGKLYNEAMPPGRMAKPEEIA